LGQLKQKISEKAYIIEGEITQPQQYGNMMYFGVKDTQETRMDCRILTYKLNYLDFPLNEGLMVQIKGTFHLNKQSKLVFEVEEIKLTGEGELLRNLMLLEKKLDREGLFAVERKRKPKKIPRNILLIASPNSAALKDFYKVLSHRRSGVNIYHQAIKTQGVGAELDILEALNQADEICKSLEIDTIVITRGGGSKDDLFVFNSERVVRAIHSLPCPSIVAIGHERDFTLAEKVADVRASTPSNAAELASQSNVEILGEKEWEWVHLTGLFQARIESYESFLQMKLDSMALLMQKDLQPATSLVQETDRLLLSFLPKHRAQVNDLWLQITENCRQNIQQLKDFLPQVTEQQANQHLIKVEQLKNYLSTMNSALVLYDTKKVLEKGYAIIRQNGQVVERKSELSQEQKGIEVEFSDGKAKL
jgi:exodeoxyribonuclease VII large subunit